MSLIYSRISHRLLCNKSFIHNAVRTLISPSYSCDSAWRDRLKTSALTKIDAASHFRKIKHAFDSGTFVSSLDLDIVTNKLHDIQPLSLELLEELFYKFRHSNESVNVFESTPHALMRTLMECGEHETLLNLLEDKINYGLFLDPFLANMLLSYFIEQKSYHNAVRVVCDLMLQEEFDDPIARALSYYACHLYIHNTPNLKIPAPPAEPTDLEVVYRKVLYINKPWFDDHFDLYNIQLKLGKSLTMLSTPEDVVSRGYMIIGNVLYLKFEKAFSLLTKWMNEEKSFVISEAHMLCVESLLNNIETAAVNVPSEPGLVRLGHILPRVTEEQKGRHVADFQEIKERLIKEGKVEKDVDANGYMEKIAREAVVEHEEGSVERLKNLYEQWNNKRDAVLDESVKMMNTKQKKDDIARKLLDLKNKEEKLKYFEEMVNINLALENQPKYPDVEVDIIEEQFVAAPGERKLGKKIKKKK